MDLLDNEYYCSNNNSRNTCHKFYGEIVSIMSALASVLTSISIFLNLKDNWQRYRKSSELIKCEINLYVHRAGGNYDNLSEEEATKRFAMNIEEISENENDGWEKHHKQPVAVG